jgi:hypothetical protein
MAVDPVTGYVFTGISCGGSCPNGASGNEFGVAVGKPFCTGGPNCPEPQPPSGGAGIGQFASESYQTASKSYQGKPWPEPGSLFPVVTMGRDRTLYEAWIEGDGMASSGAPPSQSWHLYYSYSTDLPDHKVWSPARPIDAGANTTNAMGWIAAGDAGKLAAIWLGSQGREYPSDHTNPTRPWRPYMAVSTNANSSNPTFQQTAMGNGPNHLGDICLVGTLCGATRPPGNRNMADFISVAIGPDGGAQATWASDANHVSTLPTSLVPGVPLTMTAREISGPRLVGSGAVTDSRFSTLPTTTGIGDNTGDARYPVWPRTGPGAGTNVAQLDLTGSRVQWDGTNIVVHIPVASLASLASPDTRNQTHVWWLTTWQLGGKIYFAKAESDGGAAPTFTAGAPASYDRPGLTYYTVPTLLDYRAGSTVHGVRNGNEWVITIPPSLVGMPKPGSVLESVTAYTALDNGQPPVVTVGTTGLPVDNMPSIVDATPAYNAPLSTS